MRTSMLSRAVTVAVYLVLLLPVAAQAGNVTVEFDFGASSVSILGGFIQVPPDGAIQSASGQMQFFGAAGSATAVTGAAAIHDFTLAGTFAKNDFGVNVNGAVGAAQSGPGFGQLFAGLGSAAFNPFLMNFTGGATCTGAGCTILGLPATFTGPKLVSLPTLLVFNLNSVGNAMVSGTFTFTLGGFTAVLNLVGNEVGRTFIPEPHSAGLLALGLAGLAVARRARRRL